MEALVLGAIGSSALVIGGAVGAWWRPPMRVTGIPLAFELLLEAVELAGVRPAGSGLDSLVGAVTMCRAGRYDHRLLPVVAAPGRLTGAPRARAGGA